MTFAKVAIILAISIGLFQSLASQSLALPDDEKRTIRSAQYLIEVVKEKTAENQLQQPLIVVDDLDDVIHIKWLKANPVRERWIRPNDLTKWFDLSDISALHGVELIALDNHRKRMIFSWDINDGQIGGNLLLVLNLSTLSIVKLARLEATISIYSISPNGAYLGYWYCTHGDAEHNYWGAFDLETGKQFGKVYISNRDLQTHVRIQWKTSTDLKFEIQTSPPGQDLFSSWKTVRNLKLSIP